MSPTAFLKTGLTMQSSQAGAETKATLPSSPPPNNFRSQLLPPAICSLKEDRNLGRGDHDGGGDGDEDGDWGALQDMVKKDLTKLSSINLFLL
jgi:hypothetical protein